MPNGTSNQSLFFNRINFDAATVRSRVERDLRKFFFLHVKRSKASPLLNVFSESREAKKPDFETKTESSKGRQYKRFEQEGFHWSMAQVSNSDETKS